MTWWKWTKKQRKSLKEEVDAAEEQYARAVEADNRINMLHKDIKEALESNHMGERLREHFRQSRRRPNNGVG